MSKSLLGIFDGEDVEDITALIDKLDKSSFDYLKLEGNGASIVISKAGAQQPALWVPTEQTASYTPTPSADPYAVSPTDDMKPPEETESQTPFPPIEQFSAQAAPVLPQEGVVVVESPNYGLFYAQSEPGAPPYVTVGSRVNRGDTVGLLETMKTFTAISSPEDGEIVAIHVKNEETLEPGQPLVSIKVAGD